MARYNSTLGCRFAESKFSAKTYKLHSTDQFMINNEPRIEPGSSPLKDEPVFDEHIAELMETLRLHVNAVLRLPLPVQKQTRLVRISCLFKAGKIECLVKEVRLQIDSIALALFVESQLKHDVSGLP